MGNALMIPANTPTYQCLSTDVVGGKVPGSGHKGANIYFTDTETWWKVLDDLTLVPLVYQISGSISAISLVSGSITILNFPETQSVSGSINVLNFPDTQEVSGSINVLNFPQTQYIEGYVGVSGSINVLNFPDTQKITGSVDITNFPDTQEVSGSINILNFPSVYSGSITNIPETQSVSGSINVLNFPDTQEVSGSINVLNFPTDYSGSITNLPETQSVSGSVNVLNFPESTLVSGSVSSVIYNNSGCPIISHEGIDGDIYLGTSIVQDVHEDTNNTSDINLTSVNGYSFTGSATSTLGVVGLQWSLKTDQNATVYIEESPDETNWDISRSFNYIESHGGRGETIQASQAFWRIRVTLTGTTDTTYFRLQAVLCPIATPLPSALSPDGRLLTETTLSGKENKDRHAWVSPTNSLSTSKDIRLVGTTFDGTIKDPNFWTEATTNDGIVTQNGEIQLNTSGSPNGTAKYTSYRTARFVVGSALKFTGAFAFVTAGTTDNVRRCGAYDANNGFFFQLDGSTFSVGSRKDTSDILISSGSFNGSLGKTFTPTNGEVYYKLDIEWTPIGAFYYINGELLHQSIGGHLTRQLSLPITFENNNDNNLTATILFDCLGVVISREGELYTNPTSRNIAGAESSIFKVGAGTLQRIVNNDNAGSITVYDGTSTGGRVLAVIDTTKALGTLEYGLSFNTGLYIVATGLVAATVIYE